MGAVPFLLGEYRLLIKKLEAFTGRKITPEDLERAIALMNDVRRTMKEIYEFSKRDNPPMTGLEAMYMTCSQFFTDAREWLPVARKVKKELAGRTRQREQGKRLMLVGSENDGVLFISIVESLGETEPVGTTTRYFCMLQCSSENISNLSPIPLPIASPPVRCPQ